MQDEVKVWEEPVVFPTYPVGKPDKNPMFLEKRVYQGSSGCVYPHAIIEKIYDNKVDKVYRGVYLENRYLKVMVLPELGGRIHMAFDKIRQRHFIYFNSVIKPALVGLTGPWISGGIEFNWPQHHRPSTFEPVDFELVHHADGSKTVWLNEVERMFGTKGMAGITLHPGRAYIEVRGRIYNRTPFAQTFLWWANPAVKVNEHYQSVFPPDVHAVYDHGKRDVSTFPIARGTYYKVDYSPGTDISRYANIPVPTSFMAVSSKYDFIGGYDHDSGGGLLHVANHHIAPGKKQWTWGYGDFGRAWDRNLTDDDGPYIELMTGVFTDNQPDFSWLQPYEEKTFEQYFMPYFAVGLVKCATRDVMVNLDVADNHADIRLYVTRVFESLLITLHNGNSLVFSQEIACAPETPFLTRVPLENPVAAAALSLTVEDRAQGRQLLHYTPEAETEPAIPEPARPAGKPADIATNEQLYLTGLHLEQYRHATYLPTDYYGEALRRDASDVRNNNAMGLWLLRRGHFARAEYFFRRAIDTLTTRNPNPYDGEPYYNLGCTLELQGRYADATDAFYKAVWNDAWQHAGYLHLARLAAMEGAYEEGLSCIAKSLNRNFTSHSARHVQVLLYRKLWRIPEAIASAHAALEIDPFNYGCLWELYLLYGIESQHQLQATVLEKLRRVSRNWVHNFIEYSLDYVRAGLYTEALQMLQAYAADTEDPYPLVFYYMGWISLLSNDKAGAKAWFLKGAELQADYVFPNRIEEVLVLKAALEVNPSDAKASYYLGNFWYDKRQYREAIECWEQSARLHEGFATVHRNLAIAYFNHAADPAGATRSMEKAFELDPTDARVLMELDLLYKRANRPPEQRLSLLEQFANLTNQRDDLYLERITLYNQLGEYAKARDLLQAYKFHPWEGGEGKVVAQHLVCHLELARQALVAGEATRALQLLQEAENYPPNLGEGKLPGKPENDIHYLKGVACELAGAQEEAERYFALATHGIDQPVQAVFYNDPQPDNIFYQALAWSKLKKPDLASQILERLIAFGQTHLHDDIAIDYFAVSLPDLLVFNADLNLRNKVHCLYMMGLGHLGLGGHHIQQAESCFKEVLLLDCNHQGALVHSKMIHTFFK